MSIHPVSPTSEPPAVHWRPQKLVEASSTLGEPLASWALSPLRTTHLQGAVVVRALVIVCGALCAWVLQAAACCGSSMGEALHLRHSAAWVSALWCMGIRAHVSVHLCAGDVVHSHTRCGAAFRVLVPCDGINQSCHRWHVRWTWPEGDAGAPAAMRGGSGRNPAYLILGWG